MRDDRAPGSASDGAPVKSIAIRPRSSQRQTAGRYDGERHDQQRGEITRRPANGVARPVSSPNVRPTTAAVTDPFGNGVDRLVVTVNRRVDILEQERSHHRISEGAYRTGRVVQGIFEKSDRMLGSNWKGENRVDSVTPHNRLERAVDSAAKIVPLVHDMRARLGRTDATLLRAVLGDRLSFTRCATDLRGKGSETEANYIGRRFRDALEDLASAWAAKGPVKPVPDDSFATLADRCTA